jgi:hypothetical protein
MELGGAEKLVEHRIFCRFERGRVNDRAEKDVGSMYRVEI